MKKQTTRLSFTGDDLKHEAIKKAAEKAEKAVDKADKAKARLPSRKLRTRKTSAQAEGEKLRFGKKEILEEVKAPTALKQKIIMKGTVNSALANVHRKVSEYEDDNVGVQAVNETAQAAETAAQRADTVRYSHKLRSYQQAVKLEAKADKANIKALYQKRMAENPQAAANPISRWRQKQAVKKEYAAIKAGRQMKGTATTQATASKAAAHVGKAVRETKDTGTAVLGLFRKHSHLLFGLGALALLFVILASSLSSCSLFFSGSGNAILGTSFTAEDEDILGVETDYCDMEEALRERIRKIREDYPDYDEYEMNLSEINHDPYRLAAFLTVLREDYQRKDVQKLLKKIFAAQYEYKIRHHTVEVTQSMKKRILTIDITNHGLEEIIENWGLTDEQMERYRILYEQKGNRDYLFADDIYANLGEGPHYDIPGEALTNEKFARMAREAEKYLGYPYVWGGSSPSTSFDCSGFVCWVINHSGNGWNVGRTTAEGLRQMLPAIRPDEAKPGDIIFFQGTYDTPGASHVGIYVGDGMMIHCGNPIQYASVDSGYFRSHFMCYCRLP